MSLSEFENEAVDMAVRDYVARRRPPEHLRDRLDLAFTWDGSDVILFEVRPRWDDPSVKIHEHLARAKYVKSRKKWKVYWMRADFRWHLYPPLPEVDDIAAFLDEVERDPHGCFWG